MAMSLQNCPFCGESEANYVIGLHKDDERGERTKSPVTYAVVCDYRAGGCGASSGFYEDSTMAVKRWNMRVGGGQ
jgi:hypothetical protein